MGFMILNAFTAKKFADGVVWLDETKFNSHVFRLDDAIFAKPQTFMNRVGDAVSKLATFYKIKHEDILVVHDDVDLKLGDFKFKKGSASAGHHGVEDIVSKLGDNNFWRLRIGVGRPEDARFDVEDYVLEQLSEGELSAIKELFDSKLFETLNNVVNT